MEEPELLIALGGGDPRAVGRGDAMQAEDLGVCGELFAGADAVGWRAPEFDLTGFVGEHEQRLAVTQKTRLTIAHAALAGDLDEATRAGRSDEDLAADGEGDAVAGRGEGAMGHVVHRLGHPFFAGLIEVRSEGDRHDRGAARRQIEEPKIGAILIGDAAAVKTGVLYAEVGVLRELAQVGAVGLHRPQIHRSVAVAGEIDATLRPHRPTARPGEIRGERGGLDLARGVAPQVLRGAALVTFRVAALRGEAGEK